MATVGDGPTEQEQKNSRFRQAAITYGQVAVQNGFSRAEAVYMAEVYYDDAMARQEEAAASGSHPA